ncbi:hypothetical protein RMATCC62417_13065 [Rhizopus microsporus]|nr:hypothetical protein RMATCC62417_13065 [Rhizopus microsporus]
MIVVIEAKEDEKVVNVIEEEEKKEETVAIFEEDEEVDVFVAIEETDLKNVTMKRYANDNVHINVAGSQMDSSKRKRQKEDNESK